jgi:phospholipid/cholesterol/gamma-HCH transport system permease protein
MLGGLATSSRDGIIHGIGRTTIAGVTAVGDLSLFSLRMVRWIFARRQRSSVLLSNMHAIGVQSLPVVLITGLFIGMVLAVQTYDQFKSLRMESRLGAVINISLVRELGPVLAATMLAGRVGSSMAAELGTMRVTEQIDALRALGANPIHYLVVPRFLSCFLLIPMLTALADSIGIFGGWFLSVQVLGINNFHYWHHATSYVAAYDVLCGLLKSVLFGASIALIGCHRGFHCGAGAEGVGRAATEAFVASFVIILILDFFSNVFFNSLYYLIWPGTVTLAAM